MPVDLDPRDASHLDTLGVFYYVLAILSLVGVCLPILQLSIGASLLGGFLPELSDGPGEEAFGLLMILISLAVMCFSGIVSFVYYQVGKRLRARESHTFCLIVAGLTCLSVPVGTILGIFTIMVLNHPGVQDAFE